jgi:hypothetical protein
MSSHVQASRGIYDTATVELSHGSPLTPDDLVSKSLYSVLDYCLTGRNLCSCLKNEFESNNRIERWSFFVENDSYDDKRNFNIRTNKGFK